MTPKNTKHTTLKYFLMLVLMAALLIPNPAFAFFGGKIKNFTADQVELSPDGTVGQTIKIYYTPEAVRMDGLPGAGMNPDMPKMNLSMYTFKEKDQHYIFNHDKKLYYQTSLSEDGLADAIKDYKDASQVKELGKEKVSGYKCVKKEVTITTKIYGMTQTSKILLWESDRFEVPLRTQTEDGRISEMRNIDKNGASKSDFKLPAGYKKVDNMMMVMGMDFGEMKAQTEKASQDDKKKTGKFKLPEIDKKDVEKTIQNLGDKLKNFKFGD